MGSCCTPDWHNAKHRRQLRVVDSVWDTGKTVALEIAAAPPAKNVDGLPAPIGETGNALGFSRYREGLTAIATLGADAGLLAKPVGDGGRESDSRVIVVHNINTLCCICPVRASPNASGVFVFRSGPDQQCWQYPPHREQLPCEAVKGIR